MSEVLPSVPSILAHLYTFIKLLTSAQYNYCRSGLLRGQQPIVLS